MKAGLLQWFQQSFHDLIAVAQGCGRDHFDAQLMRINDGDNELVSDQLAFLALELPVLGLEHSCRLVEDGDTITLLSQYFADHPQSLPGAVIEGEPVCLRCGTGQKSDGQQSKESNMISSHEISLIAG
jgi:hypothetical protein